MVTDMSEKGLEALISNSLISNGWLPGDPHNYDRTNCVDLSHLTTFLTTTRQETAEALSLDADTPTRRQFLTRLKRQVLDRGIIDVLRNGVQHQQHSITLFYETPTPGNAQAEENYRQNRFSVTQQLRYSNNQKQKSLGHHTVLSTAYPSSRWN